MNEMDDELNDLYNNNLMNRLLDVYQKSSRN